MSTTVLIGDARAMLDHLPSECVNCIVTSPPYFRLRKYLRPGDPNMPFEIGRESSLDAYVDNLVDIFRSLRRVLHPAGCCFLNLGDKFDSNGQLLMVPSHVALALQDEGWWIRTQIAWTKNNPLPESIKDRPTSAWEPIFLLTKSTTYFWDYEGSKEIASLDLTKRKGPTGRGQQAYAIASGQGENPHQDHSGRIGGDGITRNMRNVWQINAAAYAGAHFATFPPEIPRRAIQAATSDAGCCPACRSPYRRLVERGEPDLEHQRACGGDITGQYSGQATKDYAAAGAQNASDVKRRILAGMVKKTTIGWEPTCTCPPAPPVPCLVLDPFGGSGTTSMVAAQMGRDSIMIDLNPDYVPMVRQRISSANRSGN